MNAPTAAHLEILAELARQHPLLLSGTVELRELMEAGHVRVAGNMVGTSGLWNCTITDTGRRLLATHGPSAAHIDLVDLRVGMMDAAELTRIRQALGKVLVSEAGGRNPILRDMERLLHEVDFLRDQVSRERRERVGLEASDTGGPPPRPCC